MKKGDNFRGIQSGLRLTLRDIKGKTYFFTVERKVVDKKTGEIVIEEREREVSLDLLHFFMKGYEKA